MRMAARTRAWLKLKSLSPGHRNYASTGAAARQDGAQEAGPSSTSRLPFPRSSYPTPFEIFHLPRSCSTTQVKQRYYDLVKLYHPDKASPTTTKGKERARDDAEEVARRFQLITDAYELLRNPTRRQIYLRSGDGWVGSYAAALGKRTRSPRRSFDSWRDEAAAEIRRRNRAHSGRSADAGPFAWVFSSRRSREEDHGPFGEGFYTSNRAEEAGSWREHWHHRGAIGKNGVIFSSIATCSLLLYATQIWRVYFANTDVDDGWADYVAPEPEGDARLDADAWSSLRSASRPTDPSYLPRSSSSLAPMHLSSFVKAADERHRSAAEKLRDARAAAREPWTLVDPRCAGVDTPADEGSRRRTAPGKKWGEMYRRMLDERQPPTSSAASAQSA